MVIEAKEQAYIQYDLNNGEDNHGSIKDIEAVSNILKEAQSKQLEHHFKGEEASEDIVADCERT